MSASAAMKAVLKRVGLLLWWHPWLLTAVLCLLVLLTGVRGPDVPAADLRTWLVRDHGFVVWNDQWYAGHPTVGYSLLFPGFAALVGVRIAGALSAVAAAFAAARVVGRGASASVRAGLMWFSVIIVTEFVCGQLPFLLGVAFASWAALAIARQRPMLAAVAAAACSVASPLAGAFLLLGAIAWASAGRWRTALPLSAATVGVVVAVLAGGGGTFPLSFVTMIPILLLVGLGLYLAPPSYQALRRGLLLYGGVAVVLAFIPTPIGGNIARLGALVAGPIAIAVLWRLRRWAWLALLAIPLLAWPVSPAVGAIAHNGVDPSRHASYFAGLMTFLDAHRTPYGRVEVPMTRDHWEAAYVASKFPLARGWERQIDRRYNGLFYDDSLLTPASYEKWLQDNAIRYVALPDVTLDGAGSGEAALLRSGRVAGLTPVWTDQHWQVWSVAHAAPFISGVGRLSSIGVDSFTLHIARPGTTVVRLHHSPLWHSSDPTACISGTPDGWTQITTPQPGDVTISARASLSSFVGSLGNGDGASDAHCSAG
ncbi:MAG: hypothetical protein ACJ735_12820 [Actinomycetes bacterium]